MSTLTLRARIAALAFTILVALTALPATAEGQIFKKLKEAALGAAEDEALAQVDRLIREAIRCNVGDPTCYDQAIGDGEDVIFTDDDGEIIADDDGVPITDREDAAAQAGVDLAGEAGGDPELQRPGEGVWTNYDFVPGDRVLFADDFSDDDVGDFPRRLEWVRGNMEIVEWEGRRLLRATGENSQFAVLLPAGVPERFTIEFDIYDPVSGQGTGVVTAEAPKDGWPQGAHFNYGNWRGSGFWIGKDPASTVDDLRIREQIVSARTMVDGAYAKAYINEKRIANVPRAELERGDRITFVMWARDDAPVYIGDIRIAEGGKDLYDDLAEKGRVSTQGILFSFNSASIRPESTPTLEEIGEMLENYPDLRIAIEGHTDSQGDDIYNQELSERRAVAVRLYLIETYGIAANRLEAQGFGESQPVADNETPEGRQQNRRVELVKLD